MRQGQIINTLRAGCSFINAIKLIIGIQLKF